MTPGPSRASWTVLAAGAAAVLVVALASRWLTRAQVSNAAVASATGRGITDVVRFVFVATLVAGSVCVVLAVLSGGLAAGIEAGGRRRRLTAGWVVLVLGVLALALAALWAARRSQAVPRAPVPAGASRPTLAGRGSVAATSGADWWFVLGALVVAAVAVAWWARARSREARPRSSGSDDGREEMSLPPDDLDPAGEVDPRRAVVAAYHRLLRLFHGRGWGRWRSEAPFEHLDRVLPGEPGLVVGARTVVAGFERAEYSHHPVSLADRDRVLAALDDVVAGLQALDVPVAALAGRPPAGSPAGRAEDAR